MLICQDMLFTCCLLHASCMRERKKKKKQKHNNTESKNKAKGIWQLDLNIYQVTYYYYNTGFCNGSLLSSPTAKRS